MSWNKNGSRDRIRDAIGTTERIEVKELTRANQLDNIGLREARRVHGVHGYVEILNAPTLLDSDKTETARSHRRYLRFLHLYQRIAHHVFRGSGARLIDFQNQRVHFLVVEPFNDEAMRVATAVAIAHTLHEVIRGCNAHHPELVDARLRVGLDSGVALAVRNGTKGDREPLFLGNPANQAAKLLTGAGTGIYPSNNALGALSADWRVAQPRVSALSARQVKRCIELADLGLDVDGLIHKWKEEAQATPQKDFSFSRPTPPLANLDLDVLTPKNSRRLDAAVIYADIDGFTRFVAKRISSRAGEAEAVQALHVIRKELRDVLKGFGGRKIRYNGDCLVGLLAEGDRSTDQEATISRAVLCAAALRSAFGLIQEELGATEELGLAIGLDGGVVAITRLGPQTNRRRCIAGQAVLHAEENQQRCDGDQTALASNGHAWANKAVQELLPAETPTRELNYNKVHLHLQGRGDAKAPSISASLGIASTPPRAYGGDAG